MKTTLTPELLDFLTKSGYRYCLSKTTTTEAGKNEACILLTPLRRRPSLRLVNTVYDALFSINGEPARLANEQDEMPVLMQIDPLLMARYLKNILKLKTTTKPLKKGHA
jgi:hypothetical protein